MKTYNKTDLIAVPVYDDIKKQKNIKYGNKVYSNFPGLNMPEDDIECESFTVIFIDTLLVYKSKYCVQVYLDNSAYKSANKQIRDYVDDNLFETD